MQTDVAIPVPSRAKGISLVVTGAILWGVSGTVAQFLFHEHGFIPEWLVVIRLLFAGAILLTYAQFAEGQMIFNIWSSLVDRKQLILFAVFGMLGVQYTYFAAIHYGNAAAATVLQYLAPIFIAIYLSVRSKLIPAGIEIIAILVALLGTFLLVTGGNPNTLSISGTAIFWAICSAFALAFYTLQPARLLRTRGSILTVGWGMMIGGIAFSFIHPPWKFTGEWNTLSFLAVVFVVIFGTLIPFYCYLESLKYISPSETSLLACAEPLSAAVLAVIWLHVPFGLAEWIGTFCIIGTIFLLSIRKRSPE